MLITNRDYSIFSKNYGHDILNKERWIELCSLGLD